MKTRLTVLTADGPWCLSHKRHIKYIAEKLRVGVRPFPGIHGYSVNTNHYHQCTRLRECYQSHCGLCDYVSRPSLATETASNFCGFSVSFSDARRLHGKEGKKRQTGLRGASHTKQLTEQTNTQLRLCPDALRFRVRAKKEWVQYTAYVWNSRMCM